MQLAKWMHSNELDDAAVAALLKCSRSTVSRLRRGEVWLSPVMASRLREVTGGKVTADDFVDLRLQVTA